MKKLCILFIVILSNKIYNFAESISIAQLIEQNNNISYIPCSPQTNFSFKPLPLANNHWLHPYEGTFKETFILNIPNGIVGGRDGWVMHDHSIIHELIWQNVRPTNKFLENLLQKNTQQYESVAVIAQFGHQYYYHYMLEIIGRLALMEMNGITYDYIYTPLYAPYMKEIFKLWGIPESRLIDASNDTLIQAKELIVPSLVALTTTKNGVARLTHYSHKNITFYIRNKLLSKLGTELQNSNFSKKVFISRQDALYRKITNEDEIFERFQEQGFERYHLSTMSLSNQIRLFHNADIIVGAVGSGFTNIIFCNPHVKIIELMGTRRDTTLFYIAQYLELNYQPIKTVEFIDQNDGQYDVTMPLNAIEDICKKLLH